MKALAIADAASDSSAFQSSSLPDRLTIVEVGKEDRQDTVKPSIMPRLLASRLSSKARVDREASSSCQKKLPAQLFARITTGSYRYFFSSMYDFDHTVGQFDIIGV
jgi:hypothetical protein